MRIVSHFLAASDSSTRTKITVLGGPTLYTCPSGTSPVFWILQHFYFMLVVFPLPSSICCHQSLLTFINLSSLLICYYTLYTAVQVRVWGGYMSLPCSRMKSIEIVSFAAKNFSFGKKVPSYSFFFRNGNREKLRLFKTTYWQVGHWFNWHNISLPTFQRTFVYDIMWNPKQPRGKEQNLFWKASSNS